jgi:hypothetical protein
MTPLRLVLVPMIAFLTCATTSRALDLTNYTPFTLVIQCNGTGGSTCTGSAPLPGGGNSIIVVEDVATYCTLENDQFLAETYLAFFRPQEDEALVDLTVPAAVKISHGKLAVGNQVVRIYPQGATLLAEATVAPAIVPSVAPYCQFTVSGEQSPPTTTSN